MFDTPFRRWLGCVVVATLVAGCASKPAPTRYYLLTDPTDAQSRLGNNRPLSQLALGAVSVPVYLQSRNIAVVVGSTEIRGARSNRWAEPLGDALRRYLQEALASGFETDAPFLLDMTVHHLHGAESGAVLLDVDWRIRARGASSVLFSDQFTEQVQQSGSGFDALVFAHRQVLNRFADHVVDAVGGGGGLASQKQSAPISDAPAIKEKPNS